MDEITTARVAWIDSDSVRRARVRAWADGQCSVVEYEPDGHLDDFDAFVVEQAHPRVSYAKLIADLRQRGLDAPVLVIVSDPSQVGVVLRAGAYDVLREAGYPPEDALLLAIDPDVDLHEAVALLERGCKVETALRILI